MPLKKIAEIVNAVYIYYLTKLFIQKRPMGTNRIAITS